MRLVSAGNPPDRRGLRPSSAARSHLVEMRGLREENAAGLFELARQMRSLAVQSSRARPLVRDVLYARYEDLRLVAWTLEMFERELCEPSTSPLAFDGDTADYLRGLYAWSNAATRALLGLVGDLRRGGADWSLYRFRLEEAAHFIFDELEPQLLDAVRAAFSCTEPSEAGDHGVRSARASVQLDRAEALFAAVRDARGRLGRRVA